MKPVAIPAAIPVSPSGKSDMTNNVAMEEAKIFTKLFSTKIVVNRRFGL